MSRQDYSEDDILNGYINPGMIEKAPDGMTSRIMERIGHEAGHYSTISFLSRHRIPVISFFVTAALVAAALLAPGNTTTPVTDSLLRVLGGIESRLSDITISAFPKINLPGWVLYTFPGILLLALFDRAFNGLFSRRGR
jgi:hypothetical protein